MKAQRLPLLRSKVSARADVTRLIRNFRVARTALGTHESEKYRRAQGRTSLSTRLADVVGGAGPYGLIEGPDSQIWFTENTLNKVATDDTFSGMVAGDYSVPTAESGPYMMARAPNGGIWFTESEPVAGKIVNVARNGVMTEYLVPTPKNEPKGIAVAPDGDVWFTEEVGNKIGQV